MNALEIKHLSKSFPGFALKDISFTLPCGCIMGMIGENGAGKSTTLRLILDILHKDEGQVTILGQDNAQHMERIKEDLGVVPDEIGLPGVLTPIQIGNIMRHTFTRWDDTLYSQYLERFALPSGKSFKVFSKGMRMKLGIAIALSHHPKFLLLDEATSGLDPVVRDELLDIFNDFTRDPSHAILISSHIVSDLEKICDYVVFLHKGRLLLCEEKDRLISEYGIISCQKELLSALDPGAVLYTKTTAYGASAILRRDAVPAGLTASPINLEDLFLSMVKEES